MWDAQAADLSRSYRVITPDLRGFGKSASTNPFTIESLADDLHALLSRIDALPCGMAGLSMGGYVCLAYAKKYPMHLRSLLLVDTRAEGDSTQDRAARDKMIALVRRSGADAIANEMMGKLIAEETVCHQPKVPERLRAIMEDCPPLTIEHALSAMRDREDQTSNLPSIPAPTLILVGESDAITPPSRAKAMQELIPHSQLQIIAGAGHMSPMEKPAEVTHAMRQFLGRDCREN
jgi:pimeloyl-ACP methyl ester carboxylesterase